MNKDRELEQRLGLEEGEWTNFCKMRKDLATLHKRSRKSLKEAGLNLKQAHQFVRDPRNFTAKEWQAFEDFTEELHLFKQEIFEALEISTKPQKNLKEDFTQKKKRVRKMRKKIAKKKMDHASRQRKKRTVAFKKGWMQM